MKRRQAENLRKRLLILGISIIVMGLATSILRPIAFGSDPYTTVNMGIDRVTPISFGTAELLVNGVLLIFVFFADRSQIGVGTLLNMLCIGYISDFFLWIWNSVFPSGVFEQPVVRYLLLPVGLILFILSCAGYMGAQLGVSAYDAIPVYLEKKKLIEEHQIAIWRFHDHMHMDADDGIYRGFDEELDWGKYRVKCDGDLGWFGVVYELPETTLEELAHFFQKELDMKVVQLVGDPKMPVKRVCVLVGGGSLGLGQENLPMRHMHQENIDVAICGDITEWTLSAYVRDASQMGMHKGMLVLGHERSEEWGMKHLPAWLKSITGDLPVTFVDAKEPFTYIV